MHRYSQWFSMVFFCAVCAASADVMDYQVRIDTSGISGTAGSLDFNFNPGPLVTQAASLQILSFLSDGSLAGNPTPTGDIAGTLLSTLTFDNGTGFNDYFEDFTFGTTISFDINLYGPALSSPDGLSTSGDTFAFSMFSDAAGTIPTLTSDMTDGFALTVDVDLDGTTTVTDFSAQTSITPATVPEPCSLILLGTITAFGLRALLGSNGEPSKAQSSPRGLKADRQHC